MIEQLYTDFTTKLLPTIQEGLVITKDYFIEFFGRYVKYLIITDSIYLGISIILLVAVSKMVLISTSKHKGGEDLEYAILIIVGIPVAIICLMCTITNANNLIKDIYVPELRVYEELKDYGLKYSQ